MKKLLLLYCVFGITIIHAQKEPIECDRPDQTETPAIVPIGMFQAEVGFIFQKDDGYNHTNSLPSVLWKYGVNDNFELRLITAYLSERLNGVRSSGFTPVMIGFKVKIGDEKGIIPKTSFIGHIGLPKMASLNYKTNFVAPESRFTMQHTLSEKLTLGYNLGCEWDGMTPETTFVYTLTTGYSLGNNFGCYAELFGFAPQNDSANHNLDGGFNYLINNNFMVDLSSGIGITDNAPDHYFALGFSFRR